MSPIWASASPPTLLLNISDNGMQILTPVNYRGNLHPLRAPFGEV